MSIRIRHSISTSVRKAEWIVSLNVWTDSWTKQSIENSLDKSKQNKRELIRFVKKCFSQKYSNTTNVSLVMFLRLYTHNYVNGILYCCIFIDYISVFVRKKRKNANSSDIHIAFRVQIIIYSYTSSIVYICKI